MDIPNYEILDNGGYLIRKRYSSEVNFFFPKKVELGFIMYTPIIHNGVRKGILTLSPGYVSDGDTGARDTINTIEAFFKHDALCDLINAGLIPKGYQKQADKVYYETAKKGKMSTLRARIRYRAIRFYQTIKGWFSYGN